MGRIATPLHQTLESLYYSPSQPIPSTPLLRKPLIFTYLSQSYEDEDELAHTSTEPSKPSLSKPVPLNPPIRTTENSVVEIRAPISTCRSVADAPTTADIPTATPHKRTPRLPTTSSSQEPGSSPMLVMRNRHSSLPTTHTPTVLLGKDKYVYRTSSKLPLHTISPSLTTLATRGFLYAHAPDLTRSSLEHTKVDRFVEEVFATDPMQVVSQPIYDTDMRFLVE